MNQVKHLIAPEEDKGPRAVAWLLIGDVLGTAFLALVFWALFWL
jgi:hypothetical protein